MNDDSLAVFAPPIPGKAARVTELQRVREDLKVKVREATARENEARSRLTALEEEIAEAKSLLQDAE